MRTAAPKEKPNRQVVLQDLNLPPLLADGWYKPRDIEQIGGSVGYRYFVAGRPVIKPSVELVTVMKADRAQQFVNSFLELRNKSDAAIVRWAGKWGILGLCGCGRPFFHQRDGASGCRVQGGIERGYATEPCARYKDYAEQLWSVRQIAGCILNGKPVDAAAHAALQKELYFAKMHIGRSDGRLLVSKYLNFMLSQCDVRPTLLWFEGHRPELTLFNQAVVLGQLVVRVTLKLAGAEKWSVCKRPGCPQPFAFGKRYEKGYCWDCHRRDTFRDSKRRRRKAAGKKPRR